MPNARRAAAIVLLFSLVGIGFWTNPVFAHHRPGHSGGPPTATPTHPTPPPHPTPPGPSYPPPTEVPCLIDLIVEIPGDGTIHVKICAEPLTVGTLTLFSDPTPLGEFRTDENGVFEGTFALPSGIKPGQHTVVADGAGLAEGSGELREPIELTASTLESRSTSTRPGLPSLVVWAMALVLLGWLVRGVLRRSAHPAATGPVETSVRGGRARRRRSVDPGVPFMDTSTFEDRSLRREGAAVQTGITEADLIRRF